jgi:hypothetical protein
MIVVNNYLAHFHNIIASGPLGGPPFSFTHSGEVAPGARL